MGILLIEKTQLSVGSFYILMIIQFITLMIIQTPAFL